MHFWIFLKKILSKIFFSPLNFFLNLSIIVEREGNTEKKKGQKRGSSTIFFCKKKGGFLLFEIFFWKKSLSIIKKNTIFWRNSLYCKTLVVKKTEKEKSRSSPFPHYYFLKKWKIIITQSKKIFTLHAETKKEIIPSKRILFFSDLFFHLKKCSAFFFSSRRKRGGGNF